MLDKQDITILRSLFAEQEERLDKRMDDKLISLEERLNKRMDDKLISLEGRLNKRMDDKLEQSEAFLLDEMERYHKITMGEFKKLNDKVCVLEEYYQIRKLEDSTSEMLLRLYEQHEHRLARCEEKLCLA